MAQFYIFFVGIVTHISIVHSRPMDINSLFSIFSDCLLHLVEFQLYLISNDSVLEKSTRSKNLFLNPDLVPFQQPVVFSSYSIRTTNNAEILPFSSETDAYSLPPKVILYTCSMQLFVNYGKIFAILKDSDEFKYGLQLLLPYEFYTLLFPQFYFSELNLSYEFTQKNTKPDTFYASEKHNVYQVLVEDNQNLDLVKIKEWVYGMLHFSKPSEVANHFPRIVVTIFSNDTLNNFDSYYIVSTTDGTPFDNGVISMSLPMIHKEYIDRQIDKIGTMILRNDTWQKMWSFIDDDLDLDHNNQVELNMNQHFKEINEGPKFTNLAIWMSIDLIIFYETFSIKAEQKWIQHNFVNYVESGNVWFHQENVHRMVIQEDGIDFVSCGGLEYNKMSLTGYVSAFDKWTWILLGTIFGLSSLTLIAIHTIFSFVKFQVNVLNTLSMPINLALEQGDSLCRNASGSSYMYFLSSGWAFGMVVLSNAYRGQNITDLTQPLPPIKPETFHDLVAQNFTIYGKSARASYTELYDSIESIYNLASRINSSEFQSWNVLSSLISQSEDYPFVKKYTKVLSQTQKFTREEWEQEQGNATNLYINKLKSCDKVALMTWSFEIDEMKSLLISNLQNSNGWTIDQASKLVSTNSENFLTVRRGWILKDVVIPIRPVITKLSGIHESGIAKQWKDWKSWVTKESRIRKFHSYVTNVPSKITTASNIVVVFYVHATLLSICIAFITVEGLWGVGIPKVSCRKVCEGLGRIWQLCLQTIQSALLVNTTEKISNIVKPSYIVLFTKSIKKW